MADKKISDLTALVTVQDADIVIVSEDDGVGGWDSRRVTAANLKNYINPVAYGGIYVKDSAVTISVDSDDPDTILTQWTVNTASNNCTPDQANNKITFTKTGIYLVSFHGVVSIDSGTAVKLRLEGYLDDSIQANLHVDRSVSSADVASVGFSTFLDVTSVPADLDIRTNIDSATGRVMILEDGQLSVHKVDIT